MNSFCLYHCSRGVVKNCVDFFGLRCLGLCRPLKVNWGRQFTTDLTQSSSATYVSVSNHENYQFVQGSFVRPMALPLVSLTTRQSRVQRITNGSLKCVFNWQWFVLNSTMARVYEVTCHNVCSAEKRKSVILCIIACMVQVFTPSISSKNYIWLRFIGNSAMARVYDMLCHIVCSAEERKQVIPRIILV